MLALRHLLHAQQRWKFVPFQHTQVSTESSYSIAGLTVTLSVQAGIQITCALQLPQHASHAVLTV